MDSALRNAHLRAQPGGAPPRVSRLGRRGALLLGVLLCALIALPLRGDERLVPSPAELRALAATSVAPEARRIEGWAALLETPVGTSVYNRLTVTNDFFNTLSFVADEVQWGRTDYWATPIEFLRSAAGDCEDFAIAKYFTLLALGIPESRLKLTYVKALRLNQAHMVLTYYARPNAEPLVLDSLDGRILPASRRPDLKPVYSFNGTGLWLATQRGGTGKALGSSTRLSRWQDLLARLAGSASPSPPIQAEERP